MMSYTEEGHAQLATDSLGAQEMAQKLVGQGVVILNPTINATCPLWARGGFKNGNPAIGGMGIDSGIVLTTGRVLNFPAGVQGFNFNPKGIINSASILASSPFDGNTNLLSGAAGDAVLNTLLSNGTTTFDACVLEFDFIPAGDSIKFNYVFASEEYPEYNCSNYNDVFGFFISGPGITGQQNMALVPGTNVPVAINSINSGINGTDVTSVITNCTNMGLGSPFTNYYIDNLGNNGPNIVYNGFTTVLTARSVVQPCQTYHLKLAIADAGDDIFDSGVFLKAGSLFSIGIQTTVQGGGNGNISTSNEYCIRECKPGKFIFTRTSGSTTNIPVTIPYIVAGSAINGTDYTTIPNEVIIPADSMSVTLNIFGLPVTPLSGPKIVTLYIKDPSPCTLNPSIIDTVSMTIYDQLPLVVLTPDTAVCPNTPITIMAQPSAAMDTFSWSSAIGVANPAAPNTIIQAVNTTTYILTGSDSTGCSGKDSITITVKPVLMTTINDTTCAGGLPFIWNGISISTGGAAVATYTMPSVVTGCDSTATLNLFVNPLLATTVNDTTCTSGLPFIWNGISVPAGGAAVATYTTPSMVTGCDSTATLNLSVNPILATTVNDTTCANGLPFVWNSISVVNGGIAAATFSTYSSVTGCDSTVTLNLFVNSIFAITVNDTVCANSLPFTWNGISISTGGTAMATYTTPSMVTGCDSTTTLNLLVNPILATTVNDTICANGLPFVWNGISVANGGIAAATFPTYSLVTGCDSTVTLNLFVKPMLSAIDSIYICPANLPLSWNGQSINSGGMAVATFTSSSLLTGCDSTVTLNLFLAPVPVAFSIDTTGCSPVFFEGNNYNNNVVLSDTFKNKWGCDSSYRTVNITTYPNAPYTLVIDTFSCGSLNFEGQTYYNSTTLEKMLFSIHGCDSVNKIVHINIEHFDLLLAAEPVEPYKGEIIHFTTNGNTTDYNVYAWSPQPWFADQHKKEQYIVANESGTVWVFGQSANGCRDSAEITLKVLPLDYGVFMPNAFSPNGDGLNDKLEPRFYIKRAYEVTNFRVFDRWGKAIIASSLQQNPSWDGNYQNGQPATIGTYYYLLEVRFIDGEKVQMKGDIVLLR